MNLSRIIERHAAFQPAKTALHFRGRDISYAELWVTDKCWPDFATDDLHAAFQNFAARDRRFGGLSS